jgi:hypothetical protein
VVVVSRAEGDDECCYERVDGHNDGQRAGKVGVGNYIGVFARGITNKS